MKHAETYLRRAFVVSNVLLLVIVVSIYFLATFDVADPGLPRVVMRLLKAVPVLALLVVVASAIILPGIKLAQKQKIRRPVDIAATTLLIGLVLILAHGIYVKARTCPYVGAPYWYCEVEGGSYVGMVVLASFFGSLVGCAVWFDRKLTKKK